MSINRRDFLKTASGLLGVLIAEPLRLFVPPRESYVRIPSQSLGLSGLYSHLGILPASKELNICEGKILDMDAWDGTGYPCLIENVCVFCSGPRPRVWVYDFDLWNFRDDDAFGPLWKRLDFKDLTNHHTWHAMRRFGDDFERIARHGGGMLYRQMIERRQVT